MRHKDTPLPPGQAFPLSASQLEKFDQCERRWGFIYAAGQREPSTAANLYGLKLHNEIERYYSHLEAPRKRIRDAFRNGIYPYADHAKKLGVVVEGEWKERLGDYVYYVKPDLWSPVAMTVWDHKTTKNVDGDYVLRSAKMLVAKPQPLIYAKAAFDAYPERDHVNLVWVYYSSTSEDSPAKHSTHRVTRDEVEEGFAEHVAPLAGRCVREGHAHVERVTRLPVLAHKLEEVNSYAAANTDACFAYNTACPHMRYCDARKPKEPDPMLAAIDELLASGGQQTIKTKTERRK